MHFLESEKLLWFLFNCRINLSPFTKDFRGEGHSNESKLNFCLVPRRRMRLGP